jgi:hypothetical protein
MEESMTAQRITLRMAAAATLVALLGCQSALSAQSDQSASQPAYTVVTTAGNAGQIEIPIPASAAVSNGNSPQEAGYEISPAGANAPQPHVDASAWQAATSHAHN